MAWRGESATTCRVPSLRPSDNWHSTQLHFRLRHASNRDQTCHHLQPASNWNIATSTPQLRSTFLPSSLRPVTTPSENSIWGPPFLELPQKVYQNVSQLVRTGIQSSATPTKIPPSSIFHEQFKIFISWKFRISVESPYIFPVSLS